MFHLALVYDKVLEASQFWGSAGPIEWFFLYMQSLQLKSKIFIMNILWDNFKYDQIYYSIYDGKCLGSPMLLLFLGWNTF